MTASPFSFLPFFSEYIRGLVFPMRCNEIRARKQSREKIFPAGRDTVQRSHYLADKRERVT